MPLIDFKGSESAEVYAIESLNQIEFSNKDLDPTISISDEIPYIDKRSSHLLLEKVSVMILKHIGFEGILMHIYYIEVESAALNIFTEVFGNILMNMAKTYCIYNEIYLNEKTNEVYLSIIFQGNYSTHFVREWHT